MAKKMIGLVISSLDSEATLTFYKGISEQARKYGFLTQGCVIHPSHESTETYNAGEFFIFEAIDYSRFDGLIVALDTITAESTKQIITERLKNCPIPIIAMDCEIEGAYCISTSNYLSAKELVLHLIDQHDRKKINYISGPAGNGESDLRKQAYLDAMAERGLSTEGRVFEGSFFIEDGNRGLKAFEADENACDFDAIVCGNDIQAISTISALAKKGLRVPEDVAVTGFDNISDTVEISPSVTTITKDIYRVGTMSVDMLRDIFDGKTVAQKTIAGSRIVCRESCGCSFDENYSLEVKNRHLTDFVLEKSYRASNRTFVEMGTEVDSFKDYLDLIRRFIAKINPGCFSMFIYDDFAEIFEMDDYPAIHFPFADGTVGRLVNVLLYIDGKFLPLDQENPIGGFSFSPEGMTQNESMPAVQFLNTPLHCMNMKIGLVTFGDSAFPMTHSAYFSWVSSMNLTINRIYNNMLLTEMSRLDFLTKTYNRFGLDYYWEKYTKTAKKQNLSIGILFADVNNLKKINDCYGHDDGDYAVSTVAKALKSLERRQLKVFRYGGDEFIVLELASTADRMEAFKKNVEIFLAEECKHNGKPYRLSASLGYYIRVAGSSAPMSACLEEADRAMYLEKQNFHRKELEQ